MTLGTDRELVERCLRDDRAAWAELLGRYADLVHGLLHRTGLDRAGCADGFQEVSILLWKHLRRLEDAERLLPWIATTTRRVGWRLRKRASARTARQAAVARVDRDPGPAPDEALAGLEEEQAVREAMAVLTERCRRLLVALYFGATETSYDDVVRRLGLPRGSIGPTRRRCLEAMRKELAARGIGEGVSDAPPEASSPLDRPTGVRRGGPRRGTP